jgi:hypothetical protein
MTHYILRGPYSAVSQPVWCSFTNPSFTLVQVRVHEDDEQPGASLVSGTAPRQTGAVGGETDGSRCMESINVGRMRGPLESWWAHTGGGTALAFKQPT